MREYSLGSGVRPFSAMVCAVLSACGGGDTTPDGGEGLKTVQAIAAPAQARWSAPVALPLVPAAAANLPDGKLLLWASEDRFSYSTSPGNTYTALFDPITRAVTERLVTETDHNMFCPGTSSLPDGRILVSGGGSSGVSSIYNPTTGSWSSGGALNITRAYHAQALMGDGSVLALGGSWNGGLGNKHGELWTAAGGWRRLTGVPVDAMVGPDPQGVYAGDNHMWLIPTANGRVLQAGPSANMNWIDTRGNGAVVAAGLRGDDPYAINGSTVMYDAGKILKTGGAQAYENVAPATNTAHLIDTTDGTAKVRRLVSMSFARSYHNSVVLPNGQVLIVGGQTLPVPFSDSNAVLAPELWDPATETFTTLPAMSVPRTYHSTALLLPDARVISIGGGLCGAGCAANHPDLQIFTPHYLLNADGSPAARPAITGGPAVVSYGTTAVMTTDTAVTSFAMVRMSPTTHGVNNDQRRIALPFTTTGALQYSVSIPSNPGIALPGYYMLFALSADGVPSVAKTVRVSGDTTPQLISPGDQSGTVGVAGGLALQASGTGTISFAAAGLPPGLTLNTTTGAVTGTPSGAGTFKVTVSATNAAGTVSTELLWRVSATSGGVLTSRYVKLEALSEVFGRAWTSVAEFNLLDTSGAVMSRVGWTAAADSQETVGESAPARNAIDGSTVTFWHTQWQGAAPVPPHSLIIDRGSSGPAIGGFKVLPRQDLNNGRIASWRFHVSDDGVTWRVVAQGAWTDGTAERTVFPIATTTSGPPTIATPANLNSMVGDGVSLALSASDPDGDTLSYSVSGLPPGVAVNASTGVVSGSPNTVGNYTATALVNDGRGGSASASFGWTVAANTSTAPAPVATGAAATYTAGIAGGTGALYSWNFGDGSAVTAPSTSATVSHTFGAPGTYTVTVTVTSPTGFTASRSVVQQVSGAGSGGGTLTSRYVKLEALTEVYGHAWTALAEFNLLDSNGTVMPRTGWVATADSQETVGENAPVSNAIDGSATTFWHTKWSGTAPLPPHTLVIDRRVGTPAIGGFKALPRQDQSNGRIGSWRFHVSDDGVTWRVVAQGTWTDGAAEKTVFPIAAPANSPPTLTTPAAQTSMLGDAVSFALSARDPDGDALAYTASGLPPGLAVNATTGVISGTPTATGSYTVTVQAADGRAGTASATFGWTVTPRVLAITPVLAAPVATGVAANYTASANGPGALYAWDFGDGSAATAPSTATTASHAYAAAGRYTVTVTVTDSTGASVRRAFVQAVVVAPASTARGTSSSNTVVQTPATGNPRIWVVNQDGDSVSAFDSQTLAKLAEVAVGTGPRTAAVAPDGRLWVANKFGTSLSIVDTAAFRVASTVALPRASQPFGIVFAPNGSAAYVTLEAAGQLLKLNPSTGATVATLAVGANPRHVSVTPGSDRVFVSRFISPALPGEGTASIQTDVAGASRGGEVVVVNAAFAVERTVVLQHSEKADTTSQGRGIPNYLAAAVFSPDGASAWVPSKQDNVKRGTLRDGLGLDFQNTVRAVSSRIDLATMAEDYAARIDHDNAGLASAAAFHPTGAYLFVALQTSRQVAVIDPVSKLEVLRLDAGRAPDGLAVSPNGLRLFVSNFMDRNVQAFDLTRLVNYGELTIPSLGALSAQATEKLAAQVLNGKQLFYDARDQRLARDAYLSCAACHNDGGHDGRVWDFTSLGEGLRNTISLRGRAGGQGLLHWSGNFDEVQDFEGQIRTLAQGTGLMSDTLFNTGTRSQPLGLTKAGLSADLDALAAYLASLNTFAPSPLRNADGTLTASATAGKVVFATSCVSCHSGANFTDSGPSSLHDIGTIKPSSGRRLGALLPGIDTPTLRDVWATAPYLHDGSAATVSAAIGAHNAITLSAADLANVAAYVQQIGSEEVVAGPRVARYVRLQALTEVYGHAWTSMAEFNVLGAAGTPLPRTGWIATADSQETQGQNAPAPNAIDGSSTTIWHTQWSGASPAPPHTFTVDMGTATTVNGFKYLPRNDGTSNGNIANWRFLISADGVTWTQLGQGTFANGTTEKTVVFPP